MRASGRIFFLLHAFLVSSLNLIPTQYARGQAAQAAGSQGPAPVAEPGTLPASWNDGVKALAGKIITAAKPSRAISLDVKNISSLGAADASAIRKSLEKELASRGLSLGSGAEVRITLSENGGGYVWVAEIQGNDKQGETQRVAIVSVPRVVAGATNTKSEFLVLAKRLVWEQPVAFLDFLVSERPTSTSASTLIILEPDSLVYYRTASGKWQLWETIPFPHSGRMSRTPNGTVDASSQKVRGPGGECSGNLADPATMKCSPDATDLANAHASVRVPEREDYQTQLLSERCGDRSVGVASGNGDWTQPDSLQGYLVTDLQGSEGAPSGSPIEFDGPVVSMHGGDGESVRVVAHNLRTRNYEAYIVTATCSH